MALGSENEVRRMNSETNPRKFLSSAAVVSIGLPTLIPASTLVLVLALMSPLTTIRGKK